MSTPSTHSITDKQAVEGVVIVTWGRRWFRARGCGGFAPFPH